MPIQSPGIGSGLDVNSLVTQLMAVERQPMTQLDRKTAAYNAQLSAYGTMRSALAALQTAAGSVASLPTLRQVTASVADGSLASASATAGAATGSYSLEVQALAQAQKLKSVAFAATSTSLGAGTLSFDFGTYSGGAFSLNADKPSASVVIAAGRDSLAEVRDAINAASAGVAASIVNDGSGQRLLITSTATGAANALRVSVADADANHTDAAGLSRLAYDASTGGVARLEQTVAARDSRIALDGITITRASNTVSEAIEGVTLNLAKESPGAVTTLNVARNIDGAVTAVSGFVQAYNIAYTSLRKLSAYNTETRSGAVLQGDSTLLGVQARMRSLLSASVEAAGGYASLSALGIAFQTDGSLLGDTAKLRAALNDTTRDAATVFAAVGTPSDGKIKFAAASADATAGEYALQVTQLATRGTASGSTAAGLTISAGVNDTLQLAVNGVAATVTLSAGTYTADSLAAMLQTRVNGIAGFSASGRSVEASASGGLLTLTSKLWGSNSSVALTGGTALADLFGSSVESAGVDAAGSIGGVAATGSGRTLSARGLSVSVEDGAVGARGSLRFSRGVAERLVRMIDEVFAGTINARTSGLEASIKGVAARRDAFEVRMTKVEANLRKQFVALDRMMSSMTNTSNFLTQQLASLPGAYNPNK